MTGSSGDRVPGNGVTHAQASPLDAPVDSSWRRFTSRVPVVSGRWVGSVAGLVGVLLAVPLLFLPTHSISVDDVTDTGAGETMQFRQSFWSWGRIADTTPDIESQFDFSNTYTLVYFALSLVVGVAASLLYAFRPGPDGRILGAIGVTWLAAQVASDLVRRLGETATGFYGQSNIRVDTHAGGLLQVSSAVALCTALVAFAWRPLLGLARTVWAWSAGVTRRVAERARHDEEQEEAGPPPHVGIATIRDAHPSYDQPAWHACEGVGFSDEPGSDRDRFRPPG